MRSTAAAKAQNGERQTDFIDCVAWGRQAEFVAQWFNKGAMAIVVGRIQSRRWQDQNGNNRTAIEVNCDEVSFGETKKSRDAYNAGNQGGFTGGSSYDNGSQMRPSLPRRRLLRRSISLLEIRILQELADDDGDVPF